MARDFDGSADYLEATSAPVTALPLTLACWAITDQTTSDVTLVSTGSGGNARVQLVYGGSVAGDPLRANSTNAGNLGNGASSPNTPGSGVWFHACAVYASTTSRQAFVNGSGGTVGTDSNDCAPSTWNYAMVGARRATGIASYFNGTIAEVAIYNAALSQDEISMLAARYSPLLVRPQSLAFYAPLFGRAGASGNEEDWIGSRTLAQTSDPGLADHARIIYPRRRTVIPFPAAAGFKAAWARQNSRVIGGGV